MPASRFAQLCVCLITTPGPNGEHCPRAQACNGFGEPVRSMTAAVVKSLSGDSRCMCRLGVTGMLCSAEPAGQPDTDQPATWLLLASAVLVNSLNVWSKGGV